MAGLSDADFALFAPWLVRVEFGRGDELIIPGMPIRHIWFPVAGVASMVATTREGSQAEIGLIGREGLVGVAAVHRVEQSSLRCFIQLPGAGLRLPVERLRAALDASPVLERRLLAYAEGFLVQVGQTALAYATRTIEERLARWLLMCLDRIAGVEIALTHEALSLMLGVRRAGITVAINNLEAAGVVTARRGAIVVIDRAALLRIAGDAYGGPEDELAALLAAA